MADSTPRVTASSKCIAYSEALLQYRRSVVTDEFAVQEGQDLFRWFESVAALTDEKAPIAARSVDLGITLLKTGPDTTDRIREHIKTSYLAFAGNA